MKQQFRSCPAALTSLTTGIRSETAEAVTRSQRPLGGRNAPLLIAYGRPNPAGSFFGLSVGDIWETWLQQGITENPLPLPYRREREAISHESQFKR